jgi:hypothetical protein
MNEASPPTSKPKRRGVFDAIFGVLLVLLTLPLGLLGFAGFVQWTQSSGGMFEASLTLLGGVGAIGSLVEGVALLRAASSPVTFRVAGTLLVCAGLPGLLGATLRALGSSWGSQRAEGLMVAALATVLVLLGIGAYLDASDRPGWVPRALSLLVLFGAFAAGVMLIR